MKPKKSRIPAIFLSIIILEALAYLLLPDSGLTTLDSILKITKQDRVLFWRQRPRLNTKFQGVNVVTDEFGFRSAKSDIGKNERAYRIICLGASPTFGWGVNFHDTYPFILGQKLNKNLPSGGFEVVNAGQIGYTSFQGRVLLEKYLLNLSPDLITVSYVLNDIDRYRFYGNTGASDKELIMGNSLTIAIDNTMPKIRSFLFIKNIITELLLKNKRLSSAVFKKQFNLAGVRVSAQDYRDNLKRIIELARANNIRLIFIKMPINLSLPRLNDGENDILKGKVNLSQFYYNLASKYEKKRDFQNASDFFKKARDYQVFDCVQDGLSYQDIMEELSREYGVFLVDAVKIFRSEGENKILFNLPHDPIHPNPEGHKLIAGALYKEIALLPDVQKRRIVD